MVQLKVFIRYNVEQFAEISIPYGSIKRCGTKQSQT